jgi:hypothetical protein
MLAFFFPHSLNFPKPIAEAARLGRTGDPKFCIAQDGGVSDISKEDFFASSPSANLVGVNEEGHETSQPEVVNCASQPLFVSGI